MAESRGRNAGKKTFETTGRGEVVLAPKIIAICLDGPWGISETGAPWKACRAVVEYRGRGMAGRLATVGGGSEDKRPQVMGLCIGIGT